MHFLLVCGALDHDLPFVVQELLSWFFILSGLHGLAIDSFGSFLMQWISHLFKKRKRNSL